MTINPLVQNTVERIAEIVPLSPMAKLEIDGVLTALIDEAERRGREQAAELKAAADEVIFAWADYDEETPFDGAMNELARVVSNMP